MTIKPNPNWLVSQLKTPNPFAEMFFSDDPEKRAALRDTLTADLFPGHSAQVFQVSDNHAATALRLLLSEYTDEESWRDVTIFLEKYKEAFQIHFMHNDSPSTLFWQKVNTEELERAIMVSSSTCEKLDRLNLWHPANEYLERFKDWPLVVVERFLTPATFVKAFTAPVCSEERTICTVVYDETETIAVKLQFQVSREEVRALRRVEALWTLTHCINGFSVD